MAAAGPRHGKARPWKGAMERPAMAAAGPRHGKARPWKGAMARPRHGKARPWKGGCAAIPTRKGQAKAWGVQPAAPERVGHRVEGLHGRQAPHRQLPPRFRLQPHKDGIVVCPVAHALRHTEIQACTPCFRTGQVIPKPARATQVRSLLHLGVI